MKSLVFIHSNNMTLFFFNEDTLLDLFNWWEEHVFWH